MWTWICSALFNSLGLFLDCGKTFFCFWDANLLAVVEYPDGEAFILFFQDI